jgi:hypothetical protein
MMEALEYSRVHNAVGAAGIQRRSLHEAFSWCKTRRAFSHALYEYPMVQDELLRMRVQFEAGTLLAFEAAMAFDDSQCDSKHRVWLRLVTALAKYLTAEFAIAASRSALELIGGNGYTSDYPAARLLRDAQVLTVWEGPANIQALELLRLLGPRHGSLQQYQARLRGVLDRLPDGLGNLRQALDVRLQNDTAATGIAMRDESSGQRYARQLLHRMSLSLAFALLCERAADAHQHGNSLLTHSAWRFYEEIQPPTFGSENEQARQGVLRLLQEEEALQNFSEE